MLHFPLQKKRILAYHVTCNLFCFAKKRFARLTVICKIDNYKEEFRKQIQDDRAEKNDF